MISEASCDTEN